MATIQDVLFWVERDLTRFSKLKDSVQVRYEQEEDAPRTLKVSIYTDINRYTIVAHDSPPREPLPPGSGTTHDGSYLGCTSSSRKTRAGEDWHRGSDLADGMLNDWTWHRIISDIVSYEMVKIHKPEQCSVPAPSYDGPEMLGIKGEIENFPTVKR